MQDKKKEYLWLCCLLYTKVMLFDINIFVAEVKMYSQRKEGF